jgi:hypothetical protein
MGLVELFVLLAAVSGSAWIVGTVGWLWYRTRRLEEAIMRGTGTAPQIAEEIEELRGQLAASGEEVALLHERLDFLERLLGSGERESAQELPPATEP